MLQNIVIPQRVPKSMKNVHVAPLGLGKAECQQYGEKIRVFTFLISQAPSFDGHRLPNIPLYLLIGIESTHTSL